jgi:AraC-like DNA-binding protein
MRLVVLITSLLIIIAGVILLVRFFSNKANTYNSSAIILAILVADLVILRIGLISDHFAWEVFKYNTKTGFFFIVAGYINPILVMIHFYLLIKPQRLIRYLMLFFSILLITLFIAHSLGNTPFGLKKVELILSFTFIFLAFSCLEVFFLSNYEWDHQFKVWILFISAIEIIAILMAFWQIEVEEIQGGYSTLISNQMNLIIMNTLILVSFALIGIFPRIQFGDIGFVENSRFEVLEREVLKLTSYRSIPLSIWRFKHGSDSFKKFTGDKELIRHLEAHSSEIYQKIYQYEITSIRGLNDNLVCSDLYNLSQKLKINHNILELFFATYNNYSFSRYKRIMRVFRAEYLIENGFLHTNDMNALAEEVGFNNRVTLYNNFKEILGISPSKVARGS